MFRKQMREIMHSKGITQTALEQKTGVAHQSICRFLNDKRGTHFATVEILADALDCDIVLLPKGKAEQPEIPLDDVDFGHILISAVRYTIGRATYMPGIVQNFITPLLPYINSNTLNIIERDIREAPSYGWDIDKPGWLNLLAAIQAEQRKRAINEVDRH